MRFKSQFPNP